PSRPTYTLSYTTLFRSIFDKNRLRTGDRADDRRHTRIIAATNSDRLTFLEINAVKVFNKCGDEMLARLLAVADDIDTRLPLIVEDRKSTRLNSSHVKIS